MSRFDQLRAEHEARRKAFDAEVRDMLWKEVLAGSMRAQETSKPVTLGCIMAGCTITVSPA